MPGLILILFFCTASIISTAQRKYTCEFADTVTMVLPDSTLRNMSKMTEEQNFELTPEIEMEIYAQLKASRMSKYQLRIVRAEKDQTIISIDPSSITGSLKMTTFDSVLYKNDELYIQSATPTGFSGEALSSSKKQFVPTGKKKSILQYECDEYLSTDSTCYIWVTTELPDYINPGIRKGSVKGAVLGFQLKGQLTITKCILTRFGRGS